MNRVIYSQINVIKSEITQGIRMEAILTRLRKNKIFILHLVQNCDWEIYNP